MSEKSNNPYPFRVVGVLVLIFAAFIGSYISRWLGVPSGAPRGVAIFVAIACVYAVMHKLDK